MMPNRTTGELEIMFEGLEKHISDTVFNAKQQLTESVNRVEKDVGEVKVQTVKTNGRVTWLEKCAYILIGGGMIISAMVIPLVIYVWNQARTVDQRIHSEVQQTFNEYSP